MSHDRSVGQSFAAHQRKKIPQVLGRHRRSEDQDPPVDSWGCKQGSDPVSLMCAQSVGLVLALLCDQTFNEFSSAQTYPYSEYATEAITILFGIPGLFNVSIGQHTISRLVAVHC